MFLPKGGRGGLSGAEQTPEHDPTGRGKGRGCARGELGLGTTVHKYCSVLEHRPVGSMRVGIMRSALPRVLAVCAAVAVLASGCSPEVAFPAIHDMPPPRVDSPLTPDQVKQATDGLISDRNHLSTEPQAGAAATAAADAPPPATTAAVPALAAKQKKKAKAPAKPPAQVTAQSTAAAAVTTDAAKH